MYDLLICNGDLPALDMCTRLAHGALSIMCADGGANKARECDILPGTIIGDLDSITAETLRYYSQREVDVVHLQRQDDTDFEKAMKLLLHRASERLVILGLTGGLLDHTLGNLSILQRYIHKMDVVIFDPDYRIDVITTETHFVSEPGSRVSIVPLQPSTGVRYHALQYQLESDSLSSGINEGTCNRALDSQFTVKLESGVLLVFRPLTMDLLEL